MDPTATLSQIEDLLYDLDSDNDDLRALAEALKRWLDNGGFVPSFARADIARMECQARKLADTRDELTRLFDRLQDLAPKS